MRGLVYAKNTAPPDYRCQKCGATGCKLWRESHILACDVELMCCTCALASRGLKNVLVGPDGMCQDPMFPQHPSMRTDQVGGYVPAVPDEEPNSGYWGYTSVPDAGVKWWRSLPTYPSVG